jgi:hypothetical protein
MIMKGSLFASDLEHGCATNFANGFGCHLTILHGNGLGILSFSLCAALYTVHH